MKIDLTKLTQLELLDLRSRISDEQQDRDNATKAKIYVLKTPYRDSKTYLSANKALVELEYQLEYDMGTDFTEGDDVSISLSIAYVDQANIKFCHDYVEGAS